MPDTSSGSQTVKSTSAPWGPQQPYLEQALGAAQNIYQQGAPSYYPYDTVAPVSPETQSAWSAQTARATNGSPVVGAADNWATGILNGTSPTYGQLGDSVWSQVRPNVDSAFSGAGRYGSDAHAEALSRGYTEGIAPAFASLQANAAGQAPALAGQDYVDTAALGQVGAQRTAQSQAEIDAAQNRYQYDANAPSSWLAQYIQNIQGNYGGTQKTTQPSQAVPWWQSLLSAGAGAAGGTLGF